MYIPVHILDSFNQGTKIVAKNATEFYFSVCIINILYIMNRNDFGEKYLVFRYTCTLCANNIDLHRAAS